MAAYQVVFSSASIDLHGVLLRESLKKAFKYESGEVENRHENEVMLIIQTEKTQQEIKALAIQACSENPLLKEDVKEIDIHLQPTLTDVSFSQKGISIKRSSQQDETVWALQGAGKLFLQSSKIQKETLEEIKARDRRKLIGLLSGLSIEIAGIMDQLAAVQLRLLLARKNKASQPTNSNAPLLPNTAAIDNFLVECPIDDQEFINKLITLQNMVRGVNSASRGDWLSAVNGAASFLMLENQLKDCQQSVEMQKQKLKSETKN